VALAVYWLSFFVTAARAAFDREKKAA